MSRANAYTREGSSVYFTPTQDSFTGIENEAKYDNLTGVKENEATCDKLTGLKVAASANTKRITITVAAIISAIIIGGCIAAAILLTQTGDDNGTPGEQSVAKWLPWNDWLSCSVTCGLGVHRRYRSCKDGAFTCVGDNIETGVCTETTCPVYGKWTTWESWGGCSSSCGGGIQLRTRSCNTTDPNALDCVGNNNQNRTCSNWNCPALPYFIQTPRPKYRLTGETVTMRCYAVATAGVDYYEWFKDSLLIETVESTDETMITLYDLLPTDSGNYQCRANSRYGAIMSPVARMDVRDNPDAFCADALQLKTVSLPDGCADPDTNSTVYDVGECAAQRCRLNGSNNETSSCCVISEAVIRTVQCTDYEVQLFVVKACRCAEYTTSSLVISGTVVGFEDNSSVRFAEVWANGAFQTYTNGMGRFDFEPSILVDQINIYIVDTYLQQYLPTSKVLEISSDLAGTFNIDIKLFKASDPVELDSSVANTLVAGTSAGGSAIVQVEIPSNAFYNDNGTPYKGSVLASLTFLDPTNITQLEYIPGVFEFTDAEGQQGALDTYGVFNLYFRDSNGQPLELGAVIELYAPKDVGTGDDDIKLWRLNPEAGNWDYMPFGSSEGREKRQSQANNVGWINPEDVRPRVWWNYDMVQEQSNRCYYKVRLFEDTLLELPVTRPRQSVNIYTSSLVNDRVRTIKDYLSDNVERCLSAICDDAYAYISAFDYRLNYKTYLYAAEPFLPTSYPNLEFTIANDRKSLRSRMVKSPDGPFFEDDSVCLRSSDNNPHLRWYYDINTGNWEVMRTFTMIAPPTTELIESSRMTWYPFRNDGYRACYLKVRLEFLDSDVFDGMNLNLQLRTTSFGGAGGEVDGKVFGGRVTDIQDVENDTVCIEFKCSGIINPSYSMDPTDDYTRVKVEFDHPISQMECTMTGSDGLSRNTADDTQSGTIGGAYMFTADIESSPDSGVYFATNNNLNVANTNGISTCRAGGGASGNINPLEGLGITFSCRPKCGNWFWENRYYLYYDICD